MPTKVVAAIVDVAVKLNMDHESLWLQNSAIYECNNLWYENIEQ